MINIKRMEYKLEAAMPNKINFNSRLTFILKCLLISYLMTTGFLLLLALMLYRFGLSEKIVSICIIAIYIIVTFLAGFLAGKREGSRKFLWGLLMGSLYFLILIIVSLVINLGAYRAFRKFLYRTGALRRQRHVRRNGQLIWPFHHSPKCQTPGTFVPYIPHPPPP